MKTYFPSWLQQTAILLLWGLVYYLSGLISLKFDDPNSAIAIVWLPSGVAVAAFLSARWRDYPALILIFALASVLLDEAWQSIPLFLTTLGYSLLAMPANVLIAWLVRRFSRPNDDLHVILLWISATFVVSVFDALIVGGGYAFFTDQPVAKTISNGFVADVTGIFFATTVVMGFVNKRGPRAALSWSTRLAGLALLLLICAATVFIFDYSGTWLKTEAAALYFALSCLPIVLTMMLSLVWGNRGGSVGLLALGAIVIHFTDQHQGPFFLRGLNFTESLLLALSYLSATALLIVFVRVLRRSTTRFNPDTGRLAGNGILYRLEPETGVFSWENDLSSLLGAGYRAEFDTVERVLGYVHPSDREKLRQHWLGPVQNKHKPLIFRIKANDDEWLTLVDSGGVAMSNGGKRIIVGNWQASHYDLAI
ncbi:Predicted integral membrane sensor domain [Cedecea neteri]|uniref:Histidine kinase n=1 Tax=Cedecea neteri TaxID=158822 RepID=A0A291DWV2_9ENTR|nr:MASE1 domain-containing protein [Cedecea neteri]ATF92068.1 histidine kinase [Cedecea neteri]SQC90705.1 Predicted integral membrane sensor domain [Cedecea neteri]